MATDSRRSDGSFVVVVENTKAPEGVYKESRQSPPFSETPEMKLLQHNTITCQGP